MIINRLAIQDGARTKDNSNKRNTNRELISPISPNNAVTKAKLAPRIIKENTVVTKKKKRDPSAKGRERP